MRHLVSGRKLNRTSSHRRAMLSNLAISILDKERVETTIPKAKEVRSVVERLITYGKKGDLHSRRLAARRINDNVVLQKLFSDIAPSFKDRVGGYVRILKTSSRKGDNAPMAIIELVGRGNIETVKARRKKKETETDTSTAKKTVSAKNETVADDTKDTTKS